MKSMRYGLWLSIAVLAMVVVNIGAYSIRLLLAESLYTSRGTYAYWLSVSKLIKGVPELSIVGQPQFYSSAGDGPKLPEDEVQYTSTADPSFIKSQLGAYLRNSGFREDRDGSWQRVETKVVLTVTPSGSGRSHVRVSATY